MELRELKCTPLPPQLWQNSKLSISVIRTYRLLENILAKFKSKLTIVEIINMHSAVQTAAVNIISYKPL